MKTLVISDEIKARAPGLHVLQIEADIENPATPDALWDELETLAADVRARFEALGREMKMQVTLTRQEVFDAMHTI